MALDGMVKVVRELDHFLEESEPKEQKEDEAGVIGIGEFNEGALGEIIEGNCNIDPEK